VTDKIDRIVEKEIPEVLDETTPLEENINQPAAESNGINLTDWFKWVKFTQIRCDTALIREYKQEKSR